jgi:hypothetical protein
VVSDGREEEAKTQVQKQYLGHPAQEFIVGKAELNRRLSSGIQKREAGILFVGH